MPVKKKVICKGKVKASPVSSPIIKDRVGETYKQIPETVMGAYLMPAVKKSMGIAVTGPVAGNKSHCQPVKTPYAPI